MKKYMIAAAFTLSFSVSKLNAQVSGNANEAMGNAQYNAARANPTSASRFWADNSNDSIITVSVKGLLNLIPDTYVATFNILQTAETAETTELLMQDRIDKFKSKLTSSGANVKDMHVDMISFVPKYDVQTENRLFSKSYNEIPTGFEMQKNVNIRYHTAEQLDDFVKLAAQAEIYDLVKVDCFHSKMETFKDSLRAKCLLELKSKLKSYETLNINLDTLRKTVEEESHTISPSSRYYSYQAFSRSSTKPFKKNGSQANVNETEKTTSRYYMPLGFESFDVTINPVILEPVLQLTFQVVVKYHLKPLNKYYLISPAGEAKRLILK
ncbi:SIMPL domain-containing protein [Dyadobacter crusticola]|uniref:SIMPL domain-containing protein n=1 Tax=Dyadobacter crusticola TaxID=292407 RepID=UPI0004E145D7|nr:SIMPL domain-containing protein [Dyadobacter crusticola]